MPLNKETKPNQCLSAIPQNITKPGFMYIVGIVALMGLDENLWSWYETVVYAGSHLCYYWIWKLISHNVYKDPSKATLDLSMLMTIGMVLWYDHSTPIEHEVKSLSHLSNLIFVLDTSIHKVKSSQRQKPTDSLDKLYLVVRHQF